MARFSTKSLVKKYDKWSGSSYKTGYKSYGSSYGNSSFWMDDDFLDSDHKQANKIDFVKMAGYKRAIGNFVRIVTGKDNIPVLFSAGNQSYTDGTSVVISSKLDEKEFDSTVGLALHEGSHIALTNFKTMERFRLGNSPELQVIVDKHHAAGYDKGQWLIIPQVKELVNIIEDRRIDHFVYTSAPGYQGYYQALYDKYFNAKEIDNALKAGKFNNLTFEDYVFHICNFANPNRTLDILPGLRDIWNKIAINQIGRLKNTDQVLELSLEVYGMIMDQIGWGDVAQAKGKGAEGEDEDEKGSNGGDGNGADINEDGTNDEMGGADPNLDMAGGQASSSGDGQASEGEGEDKTDVKDAKQTAKERQEEKKLRDAIQKQKDFLNGNIKKKKMSKGDAEKINAAAESNMEYAPVGGDVQNDTQNTMRGNTTNCMVVKGITKSLIDSNLLGGHLSDPTYCKDSLTKWGRPDYIQEGIVLGTMLGKRLKTRDEDRTIKTTRMETGRIDRRLIAELGFGNDRVFSQTIHNTVTPSLIHISVDASGSMGGTKWQAAMKTAVAIAKAASMVSSLDCVISVRGSYGWGNTGAPLMWVIYDSRKEKFESAKHKFYGVQASGSTPEGLCYQAVMKDIVGSANGKDAYLINICDGEPGYSDSNLSYGGEYAIQHTKAQVDKMRKAGIKVLGYFVCEDSNSSWLARSKDQFRKMYGNESEFIDINSLTQLSNSLNKLFVRK